VAALSASAAATDAPTPSAGVAVVPAAGSALAAARTTTTPVSVAASGILTGVQRSDSAPRLDATSAAGTERSADAGTTRTPATVPIADATVSSSVAAGDRSAPLPAAGMERVAPTPPADDVAPRAAWEAFVPTVPAPPLAPIPMAPTGPEVTPGHVLFGAIALGLIGWLAIAGLRAR
jgi:hypothetical protein